MTDESNKWREFERDFRAISDPLSQLRADRTHHRGEPDDWRLAGGPATEHVSRFRILAAMAGEALHQDRAIRHVLPDEVVAEPDALNRWLTAVRLMTSAYDRDQWYGHETDENGKRVGGIVTAGRISRIIEWSAVLCLMLAAAARPVEAGQRDEDSALRTKPEKPSPRGYEGLGQKICNALQYYHDLTERQEMAVSLRIEHGLTLTEVASRMGIKRQTVDKHLAAAKTKQKLLSSKLKGHSRE